MSLSFALKRFGELDLKVRAISRFFQTPCFPAGAGPDYVNAAVAVQTDKGPHDVLQILHRIEAELGRVREERWGMRTLDLDLIAFGDQVLPDLQTQALWRGLPIFDQATTAPSELILPHPRLQDRAFVLVPLLDIAPDWRHPLLGRTIREMSGKLPKDDVESVRPL